MLEGVTRRTFGGSSGTYNVRATELARNRLSRTLQCIVIFLDDTQHTFEIHKKASGHRLMELVFSHLELVEKDYFGLQFSDNGSILPAEMMRWLDPAKSVKKQLNSTLPYTLWLRVKFYMSDPSKLQEEYTRYHFFLQLKKDVYDGKLILSPSAACLLTSYVLQSELGDYCVEEHSCGYMKAIKFLPAQHLSDDLEKKVTELHKLHRGQTPADAEYNFLDHVKRLDNYGVDLHQAKDSQDRDIHLGVTSIGLVVFYNNIKINTFSWSKIIKLSFKRRRFFILLRREPSENYDSLLGFNFVSYRSCKNLWKSCVEHHSFFRLHVSTLPGKRFHFSLGSKFRYSGRTEYQTVEEASRRVTERSFVRSSNVHTRDPLYPVMETEIFTPPKLQKPSVTATTAVSSASPNLSTSSPHMRRVHDTSSSGGKAPRKAWSDTTATQVETSVGGSIDSIDKDKAFVPSQYTRLVYADEDSSENGKSETQGKCESEGGYGLVTIRMKPDELGRFGFNVKGGNDQSIPVLVTRVAPNTPAEKCYPRLNEGDQVLLINGRDVGQMTHEQVVNFIRASRESHSGELVLTVQQNVYVCDDEVEEPTFQYVPDTPHVKDGISRSSALAESILLLQEAIQSNSLTEQFEQLYRRAPHRDCKEAKKSENVNKNRYRDISPYDVTRVALLSPHPHTYINASHITMKIPGSGIVNRYIASQGPLPHTVEDFWMMIYQTQCTLIVMVTTVVERGRVKCHKYWPDIHQTMELPHLEITTLKENKPEGGVAFREFTLCDKESGEERDITHMQYVAWPDHGVPDDSTDFVNFVKSVRAAREGQVSPTVVHCSAGIGRTGVLILMETAECLIEACEPVYPLDITRTMRDQRAMMIQTPNQYKFVCEAIVKVYTEELVKPMLEFKR